MNMLTALQDKVAKDTGIPDGEEPISFRGRRWSHPTLDIEAGRGMVDIGISRQMAAVLAARGFDRNTAPAYLNVDLGTYLPQPGYIKDLETAADRIAQAVAFGEKIAIWGDYDVDGATSSATMARVLRKAGAEVTIKIPDRIKEGYGPNTAGLLMLKQIGISLVIIVDSGTTAFEPLAAAQSAGLDCVVIDHHAAEPALPAAVAVVNPNRLDQEPGYGHMCAAGVTWLVSRSVCERLGIDPTFADSFIDIVALGTVCDVVPLTTINRAIVSRGLELVQNTSNPGIRALKLMAKINAEVQAHHFGFGIGPRINAGGRIGESWMGAHILSSDDHAECMQLAEELDRLNVERRRLEDEYLREADAMAQQQLDQAAIIVDGEGWHEGVIGIIAGRLKEAYDKPVFVFSRLDEEGPDGKVFAKGSGRSMPGFDLGKVVIASRQSQLLVKGGGHAMAAGATIELDRIEEFRAAVNEAVKGSKFAETGPSCKVDCILHPARADLQFVKSLEDLEPFGQGNPKPRFMLPAVRLTNVRMVGKDNTTLQATITRNGSELKSVLFKASDTPLGDGLRHADGRPLDLLVTLDINHYQGRDMPQAMIEDARFSVTPQAAA